MRQPARCLSQAVSCYNTIVAMIVIIMSSRTESMLSKKILLKGLASGSFSSPGYPKQYPENVSYMWIFPRYEHDVILLEFVDVNLYRCYVVDPNENCYVYDHVLVEGYLPFCNWRMPKGVLTLKKRTTVEFRTFRSKEACRGTGFNATFKVVSATIHGLTTQKPSWLSTDNRHTEDGKESQNAVKTIIIAVGAIFVVLVVVSIIACCWCWKRKKRQRNNRRHRSRTRSYSSVPEHEGERSDAQQRDEVRYSDLLRNEDRSTPRVHGPPPAYDSVFNTENASRRENSTVVDFEHPPSYETATRETSNSERQTNRTANTSRGNRHAQRIPGGSQGNREDRSVRSNRSTVNTANAENHTDTDGSIRPHANTDGQMTNTNTDSVQDYRVHDTRNQQTDARRTDGSPRPRNSRHSRARTRDERNNESTNQRRPDSTSQTRNDIVAQSDPVQSNQPTNQRRDTRDRRTNLASQTTNNSAANSSNQTELDQSNESTNQRRPVCTSQTTNQSDQVENIHQSSEDSPEAENQEIIVTESSTNPRPDNSNREVFV